MKFPRIPHAWLLITPPALFALGFLANALVMITNGNQMPVFTPGGDCSFIQYSDFVHVCVNAHTHFKFLADWVFINGASPTIASLGDFLEWAYDQTALPSFAVWATLVIKEHHDLHN